RITHPEQAAANEVPESSGTHSQQLSQLPLRPPVAHSGAHPKRSNSEANGAFGTAKALSNLLHCFVPTQVQHLVIVCLSPEAELRSSTGNGDRGLSGPAA